MENIKKIKLFLSIDYGYGYGSGSGYGDGNGYGSGYGYGYGSGYGNGYGSGYGNGYGYGSGYGYGYGYGYGDGYGNGSGNILSFQKEAVFYIDTVPTLIDKIKGNVAKGRILLSDFNTQDCYIVKRNNLFAHGNTLHEAISALNDKFFEEMPEEERILAFVEAHLKDKIYPNMDFFEWHHKLTGSCEPGRIAFAKNHGIDLESGMTVLEFIELTENNYCGETIKKLRQFYN